MKKTILLISVVVLAAFIWLNPFVPQLSDYAAETPRLNAQSFFKGDLRSFGVFQDWRGKQQAHFTMQANVTWQGDKGTMQEHFIFADGRTHERVWTFTKIDDTHFIGTAPDVVGEARGESSGNALHWTYQIKVTTDSGERTVTFDDWLYQIDDNHMVSFVTIKKFGFPVGRLTMFFQKEDASLSGFASQTPFPLDFKAKSPL